MEDYNDIIRRIPELSQEVIEDIVRENMRGWAFFEKPDRKSAQYYCTHCHSWHDYDSAKMPKHDSEMYCPSCAGKLRVHHLRYGHSKQRSSENFCIMQAVSDMEIAVRAVRIELNFNGYQTWERYEIEPNIDVAWCEWYYFAPGTALRFIGAWQDGEFTWKKASEVREPCHFGWFCYGYRDNGYILIKDGTVEYSNTLYKRADMDGIGAGRYPILWLAEFCKKPNLEILLETGFENVVDDYVNNVAVGNRQRNRQVLDLRSNNIKKILKISTKAELKYLENGDMAFIEMHQKMLKAFPKLSAPQVVDFERWLDSKRINHNHIKRIASNTGLSPTKIKNYILKQWDRGVLHGGQCPSVEMIWSDTIDAAVDCGYDLTDTAVTCPRDIVGAHDRYTAAARALKYKQEDINRADVFADQQERYAPLMFERYGLITVLPQKYSEIVAEGTNLSDCLAQYATRHAEYNTVIVFVRKKSDITKSYYAAEIDLFDSHSPLKQFYGYKNNIVRSGGRPKTVTEKKFEKRYNEYLKEQVKKIKLPKPKKEKSA